MSATNSVLLLPDFAKLEHTLDYRLFLSLVQDECMMTTDVLSQLMCTRKDFVAAVPDLVADAMRRDKISSASEAKRLTELWSTWMAGVGWAKCKMSMTNRPSLGSWKGFPWEEESVMTRCLYRGLPAAAIKALATDGSCLPWPMVVEHPDLSQVLWSSETGAADVSAVVRSCTANMLVRYAQPKAKAPAGKKGKR